MKTAKPLDFIVTDKLKQRFLSKTVIVNGCWIWKGSYRETGYGQFAITHSNIQRAHRVSYVLFKKPIPKNYLVLHTCDNPACVNPFHLRLGTNGDNMKDAVNKGRWRNQYSGDVLTQEKHYRSIVRELTNSL